MLGMRTRLEQRLFDSTLVAWLLVAWSAAGGPRGESAGGGHRVVPADDCRACHVAYGDAGAGHPIGVRVDRPVGLPLGPGDTVECATCHAVAAGHQGATGGDHLRKPAARLCAVCHGRAADERSALFHAMAMGRAHTESPRPLGNAAVDGQTRQCLSCHDGSAARSAIGDETGAAVGHQVGHIAGASYREAQRRPSLQLRSELAIPAPVRLIDGKVGCGSCHSAYSHRARMLHLPLQGGALCKACHDL